MRIEYGPPGHKGVTQIQGLGDSAKKPSVRPCTLVAGISVAAWVVGATIGSTTTKNMAMGGLAALALTAALKNGAVEAPKTLPVAVQGWG